MGNDAAVWSDVVSQCVVGCGAIRIALLDNSRSRILWQMGRRSSMSPALNVLGFSHRDGLWGGRAGAKAVAIAVG
jgi:hypothetical protein